MRGISTWAVWLVACAHALACNQILGIEEHDVVARDAAVCSGDECAGAGGTSSGGSNGGSGTTARGGRSGTSATAGSGGSADPSVAGRSGDGGEGGASGTGNAVQSGSGGAAGTCTDASCMPGDRDDDGVADGDDNCPDEKNSDQDNDDDDAEGNACDPCPTLRDVQPVCGDGNWCAPVEACDDGEQTACGACNADCTGPGGEGPPMDACAASATGVFAVKTELDVWWKDDASPPFVDPGRGKAVVYQMARVTDAGCEANTMAVLRLCGLELPPTRSDVSCEAFALSFRDAMWDEATMPSHLTTGIRPLSPGEPFQLMPSAGLFGIALPTPDSPWPLPTQAEAVTCSGAADCFPDHDDDAERGVTAVLARIGERFGTDTCTTGQPFTFRAMPRDAIGAIDPQSVRAERLQLGLRVSIGPRAVTTSNCESGKGDAISGKIELRVAACFPACSATTVDFVDSTLIDYQVLAKEVAPPASALIDQTPSVGPRSAFVRLGPTSTSFDCSAVRGASFPTL